MRPAGSSFCGLHLSRHAHIARAHYSDLVRLYALQVEGGLYLDGDAFILNKLDRWRRCAFAIGTDANEPTRPKASNGIMLAAPRSAWSAVDAQFERGVTAAAGTITRGGELRSRPGVGRRGDAGACARWLLLAVG